MKKIELVQDTIDNKDIDSLIEWLSTYPRLTKGPLTLEFESKWSEWIGTKYSVFVNSGIHVYGSIGFLPVILRIVVCKVTFSVIII